MSINNKSDMCDSGQGYWKCSIKCAFKTHDISKSSRFKQMIYQNQVEVLFLMEFISPPTTYKIRNHIPFKNGYLPYVP